MPEPKPDTKPTAVAISAGKLTNPKKIAVVCYGESLISDAHWAKCAVVSKSEAALIAALKVTDERSAKP